jgi:high-affinity Fe2+/Pb2+ permease
MEARPDVVVVVPESFLQWAEPLRYVCFGVALLIVLTVVVLVVRKRLRAKAG